MTIADPEGWAPQLDSRTGPRFAAIASALEDDVARGILPPGTRLPTHRDLARRLGVTVGTVSRAYAEAARRGLLRGEVGRGTFVRQPARLPGERAGPFDVVPRDEQLIDLGMNDPPDPPQGIDGLVAESLRRLATPGALEGVLAYPPPGGHPRHRAAGAAWIARCGLTVDPRRVVVCCGAQHGVAVTLRHLTRPGEPVLYEELSYPGAKATGDWLGIAPLPVAMDGEGIRPDALDQACRSSGARTLYTVPTLQNPTGAAMPLGRRRELVAVARAHDLTIVEDDVHALLAEPALPPLASLAPERTYYVASTAKALAPGLRVGFVAAPERQAERLADGIFATTWSAVPLAAELVARWLEDGTGERLLALRRSEAAARLELARGVLGEAVRAASPWVYHLWLTLPPHRDADALAADARRAGLVLHPARTFAIGRAVPPQAIRVCLGAPRDRERLRLGLSRLAGLLADGTSRFVTVV